MKFDSGIKQFLARTVFFIVVFIGISLLIGQKILETNLLYDFWIFIYGGMGKVLLFSIVGFVLFYREELLKLKGQTYSKRNLLFLLLSFVSTGLFYYLELNVSRIPNTFINILLVHLLFLSIFIFLILGIYGLEFIRSFLEKFKTEIKYFLIFGVVVYSLMYQVWKLWPYLSLVVLKINERLLGLFGDVIIINKSTLVFNQFAADIAEACSGVFSLFIFASLYIFGVILDFHKLNRKKVIALFIPALLGAFLVNVFRVFLLFIVGAFFSRSLALGLYHSYVGMIFFLVYFTIFWTLLFNWMKKKEFQKETRISKTYKKIMKDPLYANSIYMMLSTLIMAILGFIFWIIAARLYSTNDIGLATGLISVMGLITGLSVLGLNIGLIKFLPRARNKSDKINTSFTLVAIASVIVTSVFLMFSEAISPKLTFIHDNIFLSFLFILFMVFSVFSALIESIFIALRNTKYILVKNSIFSLFKIFSLFFFVSLGAYGIFTSWMISLILGFLIVFFILIYRFDYRPKFVFKDSIIKKMGSYSFGNYVAGFLGALPMMVIPIIILNSLGAEYTAYYYMSMMIATLLFMVPTVVSASLLAEGSYEYEHLKSKVIKAVKIISIILIPGIIITYFFGNLVLLMFGGEYASEGFEFLRLVALSGVFVGITGVMNAVMKVRGMVKGLVLANILGTIGIIGASWIGLMAGGLIGVGYGWLIGQIILTCDYIFLLGFSEFIRK